MTVKPGRYRHFRGKTYTVLGVAADTEGSEEVVVYMNDEGKLFTRSVGGFTEKVGAGWRFTYLGLTHGDAIAKLTEVMLPTEQIEELEDAK